MPKQTDVEKTLELLKEAGGRGIPSFDLGNRVGTIRVAARIRDLKDLGYVFDTKPEKFGNTWGVRYYLVGEPRVWGGEEFYQFHNKLNHLNEQHEIKFDDINNTVSYGERTDG